MERSNGSDANNSEDRPDTSILFQRYLEGGKTLNVFDWFESFRQVAEAQREERERQRALQKEKERQKQTQKGRGRSPKKQRKRRDADVDMEGGEEEKEETGMEGDEEWHVEVQARFMRALHELDHLGFIKHGGRKAGHVTRTVFDLPDDDVDSD
jgi:origin recognition complex subunit 3